MRASVQFVFLALAALVLLSPVANAQSSGGDTSRPETGLSRSDALTPTIQVYSRETILDVLVTDDKGQPVRGLARSEFTILEDGKPQPIRGFAEYDKTIPPPPPRTLPPNTFTNDNKLPASGPVQIFYIRLPCPPARSGAEYIAEYLRTMPSGTQVAIFGFRRDLGLRMVQDFTTDGPKAATAVENIELPVSTYGSFDPIAAINQIAAYVSGIHGRKDLVWFGTPLSVMRDGGYSWANPQSVPPEAPDMTFVHRLMDTYDRFTEEQIAIYPFDPSGVRAPGGPSRQDAPLGFNNLRAEEIATGTGGEAIYNTNDFKSAIAKIVDDGSHYYTLSYVPTRPDSDGHYHAITIKLSRPDLHLRYRSGYNDEQPYPPDSVLKQGMIQYRGPMRLGAIPATQVLFDLHVEPAPPALQPASASKTPHSMGAPYTATFTIDPTQIALSQNPDGTRTANLELDLGAFDSFGTLVSARSQEFKLTVTPAQYNAFFKKPLRLNVATDLPPGKLTLRAGVFDTAAGKAGTLEVPFTVPKGRPNAEATRTAAAPK